MSPLFLAPLLLLARVHGMPQPEDGECCTEKMVGGVSYTLLGTDDSGMFMELSCLSNCVFEKDGLPGSKFCFGRGDMSVECQGDMMVTPPAVPEGETGGPGDLTGGPGGETEGPGGESPPPPPVTEVPGPASGSSQGPTSSTYTQSWLRGPGDIVAHVHEGIELADGSGYIAVGNGNEEIEGSSAVIQTMVVSRVDSEGALVWTKKLGEKDSVGQTVVEVGDQLVVGGGLFKSSTGKQQASLVGLNTATGAVVWTTQLDHSGHGSIRSVILSNSSLVATGYTACPTPGFVFIAEGEAHVWRFGLDGSLTETVKLAVEGVSQGTKIRSDPVQGGYVVGSSMWTPTDDQQTVVVKLDASLKIEWSQDYGLSTGQDQCFDILVDGAGDYLLGGHTTAGEGVINWDYLAIKVSGSTRQQVWRRTYGQPRGFDARYIHDEMYGVALDKDGNYLLLGGSGDEYTAYSVNINGEKSDIWVSYLVTVDKDGQTLGQGVFGDPKKAGNEAGEYLSVSASGDIMVYTDSDSTGGFGFLKITKNV